MYFRLLDPGPTLLRWLPKSFAPKWDTMTDVRDHNKWVLKRDPLQHVQDYEGLLLSITHMFHGWCIDLHLP